MIVPPIGMLTRCGIPKIASKVFPMARNCAAVYAIMQAKIIVTEIIRIRSELSGKYVSR
jgi:hypothetical protein